MTDDQLREYEQFAGRLTSRYRDLGVLIPARGNLNDLNRLRNRLGLQNYTPGQRFRSIARGARAWASGTAKRLFNMRNLGVAVGLLGIFSQIGQAANVVNNVVNPTHEIQMRFDLFMATYRRALQQGGAGELGSPLDVALRAQLEDYLRAIGVEDLQRAVVANSFLRHFSDYLR